MKQILLLQLFALIFALTVLPFGRGTPCRINVLSHDQIFESKMVFGAEYGEYKDVGRYFSFNWNDIQKSNCPFGQRSFSETELVFKAKKTNAPEYKEVIVWNRQKKSMKNALERWSGKVGNAYGQWNEAAKPRDWTAGDVLEVEEVEDNMPVVQENVEDVTLGGSRETHETPLIDGSTVASSTTGVSCPHKLKVIGDDDRVLDAYLSGVYNMVWNETRQGWPVWQRVDGNMYIFVGGPTMRWHIVDVANYKNDTGLAYTWANFSNRCPTNRVYHVGDKNGWSESDSLRVVKVTTKNKEAVGKYEDDPLEYSNSERDKSTIGFMERKEVTETAVSITTDDGHSTSDLRQTDKVGVSTDAKKEKSGAENDYGPIDSDNDHDKSENDWSPAIVASIVIAAFSLLIGPLIILGVVHRCRRDDTTQPPPTSPDWYNTNTTLRQSATRIENKF